MKERIAIVGMACRYPDADTPEALWENILARRRAFRRMPPERLRLEDYYAADRTDPDRLYATEAAVLAGFEFDRLRYRVSGSSFRVTDMAHWLALDVASRALTDAGFGEGRGLPADATGVIVGNTLTGEFTRAATMRLRWPYVRRVLEGRLAEGDWAPARRREFLERLEAAYKAPFPEPNEESLAGGLSNTIAGRICNHFNLRGGGYTMDGACSSSLLAVANACQALAGGDLDVALAGGVDLSLDPFELIGFARTGALAPEEMRVYDARSAGFWPGEGCGFLVLMREPDARAMGLPIYARIQGWGISSDGSGGITRPEVEGQMLALNRAYRRAGYGVETVALFEGHGTGTAVGDRVELQAISAARREAAEAGAPRAAIGSVKANIGHTKAAAGAAGLIKAAMALRAQVIPPNTGVEQPHPELTGPDAALRLVAEGEAWPAHLPLRAGVSSMGFGGINVHIALEGEAAARRTALSAREQVLLSSHQDVELFLLGDLDSAGLLGQVSRLAAVAPRLARCELADLSAWTARQLRARRVRAAVVAATPAELAQRLAQLQTWLQDGRTQGVDPSNGLFLGTGLVAPRIGFLFPGQGAPVHQGSGLLGARFPFVRELYAEQSLLESTADVPDTAVAQPAIVRASLAGVRALSRLGIEAEVALGHSLGELTAYAWGGALREEEALALAARRGMAMSPQAGPAGTMASIAAGPRKVEELLEGTGAVMACYNGPAQTVIAGETAGVARAVERARQRGLTAAALPVGNAFHSPLVAGAASHLAEYLAAQPPKALQRHVVSSVTGSDLASADNLAELLVRQVTEPVRFTEAMSRLADQTDLLIEVGPGRILTGLAAGQTTVPAVATDAGSPSLAGFFRAVGAAFALGTPVRAEELYRDRFSRPIDPDQPPRFLENPCEKAPVPAADTEDRAPSVAPAPAIPAAAAPAEVAEGGVRTAAEVLELVRSLVARRTELPPDAIAPHSRLLEDLHLNSLVVGQLVVEAGRQLGLPPSAAPLEYANASLAELAGVLHERLQAGAAGEGAQSGTPVQHVPGMDTWVRAFGIRLVARPLPTRRLAAAGTGGKGWRVMAPEGHPLAPDLQRLSAWAEGGGLILCLPAEVDEAQIPHLLAGVRELLAAGRPPLVAVVQDGGGGAAFARTLHLELPGLTTCVVDVPFGHPQAAAWVMDEARHATGHVEATYGPDGVRREPVLQLLPGQAEGALPVANGDVVLVTGGGKGIGAEAALALALKAGVRLVLMGRSAPAADPELARNLERLTARGVAWRYVTADVTDADAVREALQPVQAEWGPVAAIIHAAGTNVPRPLGALTEAEFRRTAAPKLQGLRNVLNAAGDGLKLLVTFSSVIARAGMRGELDYAVANEWMAGLTERWQAAHPDCRCLALEWSVWSGVGMGERLGRVEALLHEGITPIGPDQGVAAFLDLLGRPGVPATVVVTGRLGDAPTVRWEERELPLLRFLEEPRLFYPGVELVTEARLKPDTDPYLNDHILHGQRLFPAVMGLEAMAQAAVAVTGREGRPMFEAVHLSRPVVVPDDGLRIRIAALVHGDGRVEVALRSEETAFQTDHFRAVCRFTEPEAGAATLDTLALTDGLVPLDPQADLYGGLLFQGARFQRLRAYRQIQARACVAEARFDRNVTWFGGYLPGALLLGDPGARDSVLHAIQVCVPEVTLLPVGVERLTWGEPADAATCVIEARERETDGETYVYDVLVRTDDGRVLERWEGLAFRTVRGEKKPPRLVPLLASYLERRAFPDMRLTLQHVRAGEERRAATDRAIRSLLGEAAEVVRRPDGKPEVVGGPAVSAAHGAGLVLAVTGTGALGCDLEAVAPRSPEDWAALLGPERFRLAELAAAESGEELNAAATRVWTAAESLKKAGQPADAPLSLLKTAADGWVAFVAGALVVNTYTAALRDEPRIALALAGRKPDAGV